MQNKLFIPAIIAVFFFIVSCKKKEMEHPSIVDSKIINVELKQNETYRYTMPPSDDVMEISQQAKHALVCKITSDMVHNTLFEYTPATDYTGSDEIHIGTIESGHKQGNNGGHYGGNCQGSGHNQETQTNYIFKINITGTSVADPH